MNRGYFLLLACIVASLITSGVTAQGQDENWFDDITESVGFDSVPAWRLYVSDVNGDEYPDLMIINGINKRNQLSLWLNLPADPELGTKSDRIFVDFTEESGINANHNPEIDGRVADVGALADIDNDGDVDLVTARFYYNKADYTMPEDEAVVMLNDGEGHFTLMPVSEIATFDKMNATNTAFLDYNLDGKLDLYIGTFSFDHTSVPSIYMPDYLFQGNGDGTFTDVSAASNISSIAQPLYGSNICDWNNDGWPDIITAPYCRTSGSLWKNNGDGTFTDVAKEVNYSSQHRGGDNGQALCQWEAMPADFDNDGDMDILQVLVHGGYGLGEDRTGLAINGGAENNYELTWSLTRIKRSAPSTAHIGDMSGSWIDFDNDGLLDLVINQSQYPQANQAGTERAYFLKQNASNRFDDITASLGLSDSLLAPGASEVIDFDLDGDDDLLIVVNTNKNQNNIIRLLENNIGNQNNWVGVRLKAPENVNRNAIGARIMVTAGGVTQTQELTAGHGHFGGQQPLIRNFGLGTNETIERIVVRWPSLSVEPTIIENPPINQIITIEGNVSSVEEELESTSQLVVTPNPANGRITLHLPVALRHTGSATIVDLLGKQVQSYSIATGLSSVDISVKDLTPGRYIVRIEGEDGMQSCSFILQ
ncbi:MAG: VCBS repeat-containing protein [Ignavibacteriae bacterium]|nr:VCBS repeat-containing protein [Ignavibacteriota bacterium]MCB9215164.1 VCBS repeat-containing protein [Ignavibacteria bacterium]